MSGQYDSPEPLFKLFDADPVRLSELPPFHPIYRAIQVIASTVMPPDITAAVMTVAAQVQADLQSSAQQASISAALTLTTEAMQTSATTALTTAQATNAQALATLAAAETAQTDASASAASADASATTAATSATQSGVSASASAASSIASAGSAAQSSASASQAQGYAATLQAAIATFNAQWLGPHTTDPATDNSGNPLQVGAEYLNTTDNPPTIRVYTATGWQDQDATAENAYANATLAATQAASSATASAGSATAAGNSATNAAGSATTAQNWASQSTGMVGGVDYSAKYYASLSATSATASAGSAAAAGNSATASAASATTAGNSATASANSATAAAASAASAQNWASQAAGVVGGTAYYSAMYYAQQAAATLSGTLQKANNLSDVASTATALSNIGGIAKANNLSDVANAATALANLGGASTTALNNAIAPFSGKNRIINGCARVNQRGTVAASAAGVTYGGPDRFCAHINGAPGGGVSLLQGSLILNGRAMPAIQQTVTAAVSSISGANFWSGITQFIEGFNCADLIGSPLAFSFWFYATVSGNYSVSICDSTSSYSYVTMFSAQAGILTKVMIPIPAVPMGASIPNSSATGMSVRIGAINTGTYQTATLNSWQSSVFVSAVGAVNWGATVGAIIAAAEVQLEAGAASTPFERESYAETFQKCRRYYRAIPNSVVWAGQVTSGYAIYAPFNWDEPMRAAPTASGFSASDTTVFPVSTFYPNSPTGGYFSSIPTVSTPSGYMYAAMNLSAEL